MQEDQVHPQVPLPTRPHSGKSAAYAPGVALLIEFPHPPRLRHRPARSYFGCIFATAKHYLTQLFVHYLSASGRRSSRDEMTSRLTGGGDGGCFVVCPRCRRSQCRVR